MQPLLVSIEGGPGSGKSSVIAALKGPFSNANFVMQNREEWDAAIRLSLTPGATVECKLIAQLFFLDWYETKMREAPAGELTVFESSHTAVAAYAKYHLSTSPVTNVHLTQVLDRLLSSKLHAQPFRLYILLKCTDQVAAERVKQRSVTGDTAWTQSALGELNIHIRTTLSNAAAAVVEVDANKPLSDVCTAVETIIREYIYSNSSVTQL